MVIFVAKRLLLAAVTVFVVSIFAFWLVHSMPGSPGAIALGLGATQEKIDAYNQQIGWNDPLIQQYFAWAAKAIQGNFGVSLVDGHDVGQDIMSRLPVTASLAAGATILSAIVGVVLGVTAAVRGGVADKIVGAFSGLGASLPAFWVGILLVYVFSVTLSIFPATGFVPFSTSPSAWASSLFLPVLTLAIGGAAFIARQARASMLNALTQEHIRTLRATATPTWKILYIHALRFASLPIIASIALQFIALFGGSVVAEQLFALPGLGSAIQKAVGTNDLPEVQGVVVVATIVVVAVNLLLELSTRFLDPKLRTR